MTETACTHRLDRVDSATGICGDCGEKVAESVYVRRDLLTVRSPLPPNPDQPIEVEEIEGTDAARLVIPCVGPMGKTVLLDMRTCTDRNGAQKLATLLNSYGRRLISERDYYNGELGKAKGRIEHLSWMIATTEDPTVVSDREALRTSLLLGLAQLNGELTKDASDARAEVEQAKRVAFEEIERRKAAEREGQTARRVMEILRKALEEIGPLLIEPEERT